MTPIQTKLTNTPKANPTYVQLAKRDIDGKLFWYTFVPGTTPNVILMTFATAGEAWTLPMELISARQMYVGLLAQGWSRL